MKLRLITTCVLVAMMSTIAGAQSLKPLNKVAKFERTDNQQTILRSLDERMPDILGIFDQAEDINNLPAPVADFLENYQRALKEIEEGGDANDIFMLDKIVAETTDSVGPVLGEIAFNQGYPYNDQCPYIGTDGQAVTGCVATAMAEIMRFWKYPNCGKGEAVYTSSQGAKTFEYSKHPFDWDNILPTYDNVDFTGAQKDAIANLMLACGASVRMNYSAEGSGTQSELVPDAMTKIFGYSKDIYRYDFRSQPTDRDYEELIDDLMYEFDNNRPVYYAGQGTKGGHAFVADGYKITDNKTYFHINWGWGGSGNGWFLLTRLDSGDDVYSNLPQVIVSIIPGDGVGVENLENNEPTVSKEIVDGQLLINRNGVVYNTLGQEIK